MQISCKNCGYKWEYAGNKHRTSCSKCRTSITLATIAGAEYVHTKLYTETVKPDIVKFPLSLWKDVRLAQRFYGLKATGEEYVILKINSEGILSLY